MESLPGYVSIVFILTTFAAVAFLLRALRAAGLQRLPSKILLFLLPLWIIFQAILAVGGFYQDETSLPPKLFLFGVLPALLLIISYFTFFRSSFVERLPLRLLTLVHVVRIPVELVLLWLFFGGMVPQVMTFEGWNFDIASGFLAIIIYFVAFRGSLTNRTLLFGFNVLGLVFLANIVSIALLSLQSPMQQMAFDKPNRAVLFFPYVWLPTIVVPIVLLSHLAALWKLAKGKIN
ncbi:MAG: hypothetical protein ABJB40_00930 [Acidobacteriota bacterium]